SASASSMICNNGRRGALRLDAVCACMLCSAKRAPLFGRGGAAKKRSRFTFMQCSMFAHTRFRLSVTALVALLCLLGAGARNLHAQDVDGTGEDSDDPIKLYQRAQAAKARAQLDVALALLRLRAGDKDEALALYKRATEDENAAADIWAARGSLERASGDEKSAAASLKRALQLDPKNILAREERAELRAAAGDYAH